ncbi:10861_t:CDS:2, partial [Gigaspora margarita]
NYYLKPWRLASLNYYYSNIAEEDWCNAGENINIAEAAHTDANRKRIQMRPIDKATKSIKKFETSKCKKQVPTNKGSSNSNAAIENKRELNNLDSEIAKREKLQNLN